MMKKNSNKNSGTGWLAGLVNKLRNRQPADPLHCMMKKLRKQTRNNGSRMPYSLRFVWITENGGSPHIVELCHVIVEIEQHGVDKKTLDCAYQYLHSFPLDEQIKNVSKLPKNWADIVIAGVESRYGKPTVSPMTADSEIFSHHYSSHAITVEEASFDEFMAHAEPEKVQKVGT